MTIKGIVFDDQTMTPKAFARAMEKVLRDGILEGCAVTGSGTNLSVAQGFMIVKGRTVEVDSATAIATSPTYADGYGRLKLVLDTSQTSGAQVYTEMVYSQTETFPALVQQDVNGAASGKYEVALATVKYSSGSVSTVTLTLGGAAVSQSFTGSRALVTSEAGAITPSAVTASELGFLSGVTSAVQTQLNAKQKSIPHGTEIPPGLADGDYFVLLTQEE